MSVFDKPGRQAVQYYLPGKKRPFAGSTKATADLIAMLADDHKGDLRKVHRAINYDQDAKAILAHYIEKLPEDETVRFLGQEFSS